MKLTVKKPTEIDATAIRLAVPFDDDDDVASDFPGRSGNAITLTLDIDTRKVRDWPAGRNENLYLKVVDQGCYYLLAGDECVAQREENYVPACVPGEWGDYVSLNVSGDGTVEGWHPTAREIAEAFFPED